MNNQILAAIFYDMANILEILNVQWKPQAFRNAARAIESLSEDVSNIYKKEGIIGIRKISGVGQSIALKVVEFIETGKIEDYASLKKEIPKGLMDLMHIQSLGPKKVSVLYQKLGIKNLRDLKKAAKASKIQKLVGFGIKSEQEILSGISMFQGAGERMLVGYARPIAEEIVERLKRVKGVKRVEIAGSLRRYKETIGDIDILATSKDSNAVMGVFISMPGVKKILVKGPTKSSIILENGFQCDLRVVNDDIFGAALQYFTGDKIHNVETRKIAIKKGYKLSEYGLFNRRTGKLVVANTEEAVYKKLSMQYVPPELRVNSGEIEVALKNKLPKLVELKDIKGDFQMHTKWSDGAGTIEDMAKAAKALGYKYILITDHSKSTRIANGMDEKRILKQMKEIDKIDKKIEGIKIFKGAEVDILSSNSLDYADDILKKLDIVLVSIHSGFKQSRSKIMKRIESAFENKHVKIFGHPTGRLIHTRKPYDIDIEHLCQIAKDTKTALEINASMHRLDLKDVHVREAVKRGVKLTLGTDAHAIAQLNQMPLGVAQAKRGWAEKKDIINTMTLKQLQKYWGLK